MITRRTFLQGTAAAFVSACGMPQRQHDADAREVVSTVAGMRSRDGAGVSLRRTVGSGQLPLLDPFLLLDEIRSANPADWQAGFPEHPHRGFETVSYLIDGAFEHRDSVGNHGRIGAGDVQWMTAGRGIVHSEMPKQEAGHLLWGLQLWVNLPAAQKMRKPRYQDLARAAIVETSLGDAQLRLVAGRIGSRRGPVEEIAVGPTMFEVALGERGRFVHPLPAADNTFVQVLDGEFAVGARAARLGSGQLAVLGPGRDLVLASPRGGRALVLSALPIGEPVARRGPFVMNTDAELDQAFADYRSGRLAGG